jgi:ABC-2 type transport system ATP-binding protein
MIRVRDLVKQFGPTTAVAGISFDVSRGEVVGFLGPNGAGKTTTLRVLTCFHPATSGTVEVGGADVYTQSVEVRRQIGYLPENVPLYPDLRVEEYLRYRAALKGVPRRERAGAVAQAMERADVVDVRRKLVGHVSRGYRQRVGLADALVARPPILVLDEPTTGLDPNQRRRMKALVRELAEAHTILFSSHILSEVQDVSSRIVIIDQGRIRADGTPQALLAGSRGRRLVVTALLPADALGGLLRSLPGVLGETAHVTAAGPDGFNTAVVDVPGDVDPRDGAAARLSEVRARIRELRLDLPTLEEFFVQVTRGEASAQTRAEDDAA